MLQIHTAERIQLLADQLAEVLAAAPSDPMSPEWVAVPSEGMRRWLSLELARRLGATAGPDGGASGDGVAANIESAFPGSLRLRVLEAGHDPQEPDPWRVERLAWVVLEVLLGAASDPVLAPLVDLPPGGSRYGRARRIADLFDRYHVHRGDMVRAWATGNDLDGSGRMLAPHHRWQPHLWRQVRSRLGTASPPERLPGLLERLRAGDLPVELPPRLAVFGLTLLPGGAGFLELAHAIGASRDVYVFLLEPSPVAAARLSVEVQPTTAGAPRTRAEDRSADVVRHPLLRSWGRLHRETTVLLADARRSGLPAPQRLDVPVPQPLGPTGVLARLQADIRNDQAPTADLRPTDDDRSVQFHACYGSTRQVEVLRDALLHLLADRELGLTEDDIVVLCPALERMAPTIEAVFGPSAEVLRSDGRRDRAPAAAPALRYRIADRSIRSANPVLSATAALLDLVAGRFDAASVLDFVSLAPVRDRYRLSDDEISRIGEWVAATNVRWGIDPQHRRALGVRETITANTWQAATERLLVGSAVHDDDHVLAIGDVAPHGIESDDVLTAGRLSDLLWRLGELAAETATARPVEEWVQVLRDCAQALFSTPGDGAWQIEGLLRVLGDISDCAGVDGHSSSAPLEFVDLRRVLSDRLSGAPGRPDFFRGGITISSMTPLRSVPYRVVALLGMDQAAFGAGSVDGDDLAAATPLLGDREHRAEARQSLLEAVLSAGDRLLVVRDGRDVRTNHEVPAAVVVAELRDAVLAMVDEHDRSAYAERLEVHHPRQPFDERCFVPGALLPDRPWGFDRSALDGAAARRHRGPLDPPFLTEPFPRDDAKVIELSSLQEFLKHPVRHFLRHRLGVRLPGRDEGVTSLLPVHLDPLERWKVGDRLLRTLLDGGTVEDWVRIERRLGTLPPEVLGQKVVDEVTDIVETLMAEADARGLRYGAAGSVPVDARLSDGTRIVGSVSDRLTRNQGPLRLTFSTAKPANRVAAWLDLMALAASDPAGQWRSVGINRVGSKASKLEVIDYTPLGEGEERRSTAVEALEVAVDCYRRGSREPIPLFPRVSPRVHLDEPAGSEWLHNMGFGDGDDVANALVYGQYDIHGLLDIPARDDDPGEQSSGRGRVARFADHLWTAIGSSVLDRGTAVADDVLGVEEPPEEVGSGR